MKKSRKIQALLALAAVCTALTLAACAPGGDSSGGEGGGAEASGDYSVGSMMAVHQKGVIDPEKEYVKKDCLSCHPRESVEAATADYGGESGVNPHAAHTEAYDCMVCHSITGVSSLKCNECHDWELPEGWESPEKTSTVPSGKQS